MDNFELVKSQAKINGKMILLSFTGSDWCHWCVKLEDEILSTANFTAWADAYFVTLRIDFPKRTALAPALAAENERLARLFHVEGFPTLILCDADGNEFARTGYRPGGSEAYIEHLKSLLKQA